MTDKGVSVRLKSINDVLSRIGLLLVVETALPASDAPTVLRIIRASRYPLSQD